MDIESDEPDIPPPPPDAVVLCRFCDRDASRPDKGNPRNAPTLEGALSTPLPVVHQASTVMCSACHVKIGKARKKREAHALQPLGGSKPKGKRVKADGTSAVEGGLGSVTGIEEPAGGTSSLVAGGEGQNKGQKKSSSFETSTPEEQAASTLSTSPLPHVTLPLTTVQQQCRQYGGGAAVVAQHPLLLRLLLVRRGTPPSLAAHSCITVSPPPYVEFYY